MDGVAIGPTWRRGAAGGWDLPAFTLGWQILGWTKKYLLQPDGPEAGAAWTFTPEQARFLLWWYGVDERGRFLYRRGMLRRMKGWGKDPLGAALAVVEFVGPCRFGGWERGQAQPKAVPHPAPWVVTAAVSQDQTRNTTTLLPGMVSKRALTEYGIELGKTVVYAQGGRARLDAVTSSPRAMEGMRPTFTLKNEALALDTRIPTPSGWTTVGDVRPGDVIYGSAGPVTVTAVTPVQEGRACFAVLFEDGERIVADDGHLWVSKPTGSAAKPRVRTTVEMFEDGRTFAVPQHGPLASPDAALPLDPYLLGYWLGDGDARAPIITAGVKDMPSLRAELTARGFMVTDLASSRAPRVSVRLVGARRNRNDPRPAGVRTWLATLGVLRNKHIPAIYLRGSIAQRLDLLRGLMDSDGSVISGQSQAIFVNQNEALARGVAELAESLGYRVGVARTLDERWSRPREGWRVTFRADERVNPFLLRRKAHNVTGQRRPWKSIQSIEPVASVPVKCIEVAAADHLFVVGEHWTLTHNTHHWTGTNEGLEMSAVIARNAAKSRDGSSRVLAISNAHNPGERSDAEADFEAYLKIASGRSVASGFLYDSLEAPPDTEMSAPDSLRAGLLAARGDSTWLDVDRLMEEILDPTTSPAMSRRFYLNQVVAAEDAWVAPHEWDACGVEGAAVKPGEMITMGFDGSKADDMTALIGCRIDDGLLFEIGAWDPADYQSRDADGVVRGEVPSAAIAGAVAKAFEAYDVVGFLADVHPWESYVDAWEEAFGEGLCAKASERRAIAFDMRQERMATLMVEGLHAAIVEREARHGREPGLSEHIYNARRRPNRVGISFAKESRFSSRKIDRAAAAALAWKARQLYLLLPESKKRQRDAVVDVWFA